MLMKLANMPTMAEELSSIANIQMLNGIHGHLYVCTWAFRLVYTVVPVVTVEAAIVEGGRGESKSVKTRSRVKGKRSLGIPSRLRGDEGVPVRRAQVAVRSSKEFLKVGLLGYVVVDIGNEIDVVVRGSKRIVSRRSISSSSS